MAEWTCSCGNRNTRIECPMCGIERPTTALAPRSPIEIRRYCHDGGTLDIQGRCGIGDGFPVEMACPFVCPICRHALEWSGGCFGCHGSLTPDDRQTWTFPGDRYDTHDERGRPIGNGQHWVWQATGPRLACRPEQNQEAAAMLARVLGAFDPRTKTLHV